MGVFVIKTCTFFGHSDCDNKIEPILQSTLIDLIANKNVKMFYVGNHGNFDYMVKNNLEKFKKDYPHINYQIVLAYMPGKKDEFDYKDYSNTIYPDGLENVPPKFAIVWRNKWMLNRSDYVVTNVTHTIGGASRFKELAEKKNKIVINLPNLIN